MIEPTGLVSRRFFLWPVVAAALLSASCATGGGSVRRGSFDVMYANAVVQGPAERLPAAEYDRKSRQLARAESLYLKADGILSRELERRFPGIGASLSEGRAAGTLAGATTRDLALLYWNAAALMSAFSLSPLDMRLAIRVKSASALMDRAYALDPDYGDGRLDEFYISYYGSLPSYLGGDKALAKLHFDEAIRKSGGGSVSAYVAYAMAVCVPEQDYETWKKLMTAALSIDLKKFPSRRLANENARKKAAWLYSKRDELFLSAEGE